MVVLNVTSCPLRLRGDLSKWLNEISTGVYIGRISARIRSELWDRVCENINDGQAVMIYSSNNAQGFEILVHNTPWEPVDYEGVTLMRRPLPKANDSDAELYSGFSKAAKYEKIRRAGKADQAKPYIVLDLETTGLDYQKDRIIEIGAVKVEGNTVTDRFHRLIKQEKPIPKEIVALTGITDDLLNREGADEKETVENLMNFTGHDNIMVIGYNVKFDIQFIQRACKRHDLKNEIRRTKDVLQLARRTISDIKDYKLYTVASYFSIDIVQCHRALDDCELTKRIYDELNKM